jgi:hypothetical protein
MSTNPSSSNVPPCFSSMRQYRVWKSMASRIRAGASGYCEDCTPEFQQLRIEQGRCLHPGTTFHCGSDGFVDGVRPGCRLPTRHKPTAKEAR